MVRNDAHGGILGHDELNGKNIHRLENVMTMRTDLHWVFDDLGLWFEATVGLYCTSVPTSIDFWQDVINQYALRATNAFVLEDLPATVTFIAQAGLPLPDPRYLALHAACAKVAHLSGAGEYIDAVSRDIDTTLVLAKDGSSAKLLAEAMSSILITAWFPPARVLIINLVNKYTGTVI